MGDAERVLKTRMLRTRVNEMSKPKLPNPFHPLELRGVYHGNFKFVKRDVAMDRVAHFFGFHRSPPTDAPELSPPPRPS